jgi:biopolymer transport protein ExbB
MAMLVVRLEEIMKKWITILVVGIVLSLGPIWGLLGTVFGMTQAFGHLAESEIEVGALSNDISLALYTTLAGLLALPIGIALIVVAIIKLSKGKQQEQAAEPA